MSGRPRHVVVIGGGIAGLSAAWALHQAQLSVTVLEAGHEAGGHARTIREDGFVVELGPNGFLARPDEPEPMTLIRGVGLEPALIEARPQAKRRFIWHGGRLRRVPESPPALLGTDVLSMAGKFRLLMEPWAPAPPAGVEETVWQFAARRIGREAADTLVDAAISGISAGDSRVLSVSAAFPRMVAMERDYGSLIRAMMARRGGMPRLVGLPDGLGSLVHAIAARLGPALHTGAPVTRLERAGDAWRIALAGGGTSEADTVLLATPAWRAADVVRALDARLADALGAIPSAGVAMVALAYAVRDVPRPVDGYGFLVDRASELDTLGVVWESSLFEGRAPADHVLLRAMMGGARHPGVAALDDEALETRARAELARTMGITAPPRRTWVARHPQGIAQYTLGHRERVARIRALAAAHDGLAVCGTSYDGVSFAAAITSGLAAGAKIAAAAVREERRTA